LSLTVNGASLNVEVEPRRLLCDVLRHDLGLTGTHVGCEHGVCGVCTVLVDGQAERSCMTFAVQAEGCSIETVEGLADAPGALSPLQAAFQEHHGLQCGFCTPGILMTARDLLSRNPSPSESEIRQALTGSICRCTGYQSIVAAIAAAASQLGEGR
jgi:carbon-monoxide dehydrogenase small subunit